MQVPADDLLVGCCNYYSYRSYVSLRFVVKTLQILFKVKLPNRRPAISTDGLSRLLFIILGLFKQTIQFY